MSCYDTCFFERYAHETLKRYLGHEYDDLVNRDRPDLQSPDGCTIGIEVTRAMEENKYAAESLLDDMSGMTEMNSDDGDMEQFLLNGYGYGLNVGGVIGPNEKLYWSMASPMKRILESKVSKLIGGLYGDFRKNGLYVFCKDDLSEADVSGACGLVMEMQYFQERRYDLLLLSEVNYLHVCNLRDDISDSFRLSSYPISIESRRELYCASVR